MEKHKQFDFIVIGGGSGGVRAARRAGALGFKVALFEKDRMGGTCVLRGCIPKKLMFYGARLPEQIQLAHDYGWSVSSKSLNWKLQNERREKELSRLSSIYKKLIEDSGVTLISQEARLTSEGFVQAGGQTYQAKYILIAVGGYPYSLPLPGAENTLTSDEIFQLEEIPKSLIVIGAGYIALEFAGIFASLGIPVTLLFRKPLVLTGFDQDVRSFFQKQAQIKGLNIVNHFEPVEIKKEKDGLIVLNKEGKSYSAETVLMATGRKPATQSLNLKQAGVQTDKQGYIQISSQFQTSLSHVYAIGDCANTPYQLTPVALAEAEILVKNLFQQSDLEMDYNLVPSAVFSNPNIAVVGLTEEQAKKNNFDIQVYKTEFRHLKNTMKPDRTEEKVFIKMIVDKKTDLVLGCHIVGDDAGEIIQGVAVAMRARATKTHFDQTVGVHPSLAEELCTLRAET